ncbi:hypothetical protein SAY86_017215 [Trapa natans]|uniref:Uncharacterized protein n=1 Tax=Trapa natans TaxID=22666 RepID=A0AAN7LNX5_TRANT|nr:hypothetical protein SAY86_017215 [Trapa natans]
MEKGRLLMDWRRNTVCLGGGGLLLLLLRRYKPRQSMSTPLSNFLKPLCAGLLHCWHVLKAGDSSVRRPLVGLFLSLLKSLMRFVWPCRWLEWTFSASEELSASTLCLMNSSSSDDALEVHHSSSFDGALEVHHSDDGSQLAEDGVLEQTSTEGALEENKEAVILDPKPLIISMADPGDQSSGRCFFMKCGLPINALSGNEADLTLLEWIREREGNGIMALATLEVPGASCSTYIRDEIKLLIKSLIQFIQYIHDQGECTSGSTFRPKNIHVVGENLIFKKLKLCSLTEELQEKDYHSVLRMIMTSIVKKKIKLLPYDLQHLLKLLKNPRPHKYLIRKHVALMSSSTCRDFILLLWDKKKTMNSKILSAWQESIDGLSLGKDCWKENIHKESILLNVYNGGKYKDTNKVHLIRFFRNAAAHLSDHSCNGEKFQFEHISLIITDSFPNVLADFQESLYRLGILQEFL